MAHFKPVSLQCHGETGLKRGHCHSVSLVRPPPQMQMLHLHQIFAIRRRFPIKTGRLRRVRFNQLGPLGILNRQQNLGRATHRSRVAFHNKTLVFCGLEFETVNIAPLFNPPAHTTGNLDQLRFFHRVVGLYFHLLLKIRHMHHHWGPHLPGCPLRIDLNRLQIRVHSAFNLNSCHTV